MKVGIIGSGDVAKALGDGLLAHGHETMLGTRDAAKLADWQRKNPKGRVGNFAETAAFGEIVILAVKGLVAAEALRGAGSENIAGKVVIDTCNPIADAPPVNGVLQILYRTERFADGGAADRVPRNQLRESLQFRRRPAASSTPIRRRPAHHVHLRQQCGCKTDRHCPARPIRLGDGRYGRRRSCARHRTALHALVHSRIYAQRMDSRV